MFQGSRGFQEKLLGGVGQGNSCFHSQKVVRQGILRAPVPAPLPIFFCLVFWAHYSQGRGGSAVALVLLCQNLWETEHIDH